MLRKMQCQKGRKRKKTGALKSEMGRNLNLLLTIGFFKKKRQILF